MICPVCEMPQPGPHGIMCKIEARELAHRMTVETLMYESTPWGEAPTRGAMLARLDAFLARYADALDRDADWMDSFATYAQCKSLRDKAARVRALAQPRLPGMYS